MGSSSKHHGCSLLLRDQTLLRLLPICLPMAAIAILACAGTWTISVFRLKTRNAEYQIGAQRYKMTGFAPRCVVAVQGCADQSTALRFAYPAPADWPDEIKHISLWLLLHFILAILLLVYLIAVLGSLFSPGYRYHRSEAILRPPWWTSVPAAILVCLLLGLASRDAAFWGVGAKVGLKPDVLGYLWVCDS